MRRITPAERERQGLLTEYENFRPLFDKRVTGVAQSELSVSIGNESFSVTAQITHGSSFNLRPNTLCVSLTVNEASISYLWEQRLLLSKSSVTVESLRARGVKKQFRDPNIQESQHWKAWLEQLRKKHQRDLAAKTPTP